MNKKSNNNKSNRGGSRPGAGRPRGPKTRVTSVRLRADLLAALRASGCHNLNGLINRLLTAHLRAVEGGGE